MNVKPPCFVLLAAVVFLSVGCGKSTGSLTGKVTLNGEPLEAGQVSAFNDKNELITSSMIVDGTYTLTNLPPGPVTLLVATYQPGGDPVIEGLPKSSPHAPPVSPDAKKKVYDSLPEKTREQIAKLKPVPPKYGNPAQSDLKTTVKAGTSTYDVAMTGKGEIPKAPVIRPGGGGGPPPPPPFPPR